MTNKDSVIMRHILEIRFSKRQFAFRDFCGKLADYLVEKTKFDKIRFADIRIDAVSDDLREAYFLSWENFGLQVDSVETFDVFNEKVKKLIEIVNSFDEYQKENIYRIGTRSSILFHRKGESLDVLKQRFKNKMANNSQELEKAIGLKISDVGYTYDMESENHQSHLLLGPVTKQEAIQKFFGKNSYGDLFKNDHGIYYEIDLFKENKEEFDFSQIEELVSENISAIETGFNEFIKYFYQEA